MGILIRESSTYPVLKNFDKKGRPLIRAGFWIIYYNVFLLFVQLGMIYGIIYEIPRPFTIMKVKSLSLSIFVFLWSALIMIWSTVHVDILDLDRKILIIYRPLFHLKVPLDQVRKILIENPPSVNRFKIMLKIQDKKVNIWLNHYFAGSYGFIQNLYLAVELPYPPEIANIKVMRYNSFLGDILGLPDDIGMTPEKKAERWARIRAKSPLSQKRKRKQKKVNEEMKKKNV